MDISVVDVISIIELSRFCFDTRDRSWGESRICKSWIRSPDPEASASQCLDRRVHQVFHQEVYTIPVRKRFRS